MSTEEKIEKLTHSFMALSEEGRQYALGIIDALAYATGHTHEPDNKERSEEEK